MTNTDSVITELLGHWQESDEARTQIMPLVYGNLRLIAHRLFAHERIGHTLQPTGLIHEAYVRLIKGGPFPDQEHFFRAAAHAMREALVDYARRHRAAKRGSGFAHVEIDERIASRNQECDEILNMNQALRRLARIDARQARIVQLQFFTGLSLREAASALGISYATAKADWSKSKLWLKSQLEK